MTFIISRRARAVLLIATTSFLSACFAPKSPPSDDFTPDRVTIASADIPSCPDLSGTYRLPATGAEARMFSPYLLPSHTMEVVRLTKTSNNWFQFKTKLRKASFHEQVQSLRQSNPERYAKWHDTVTRWQQVVRENRLSPSILESDVLELGPLPVRGGLFTPRQCEDHWMLLEYITWGRNDSHPLAEGRQGDETEIWASRNKSGELIFRYDDYSTASSIFNSTLRTGLVASRYAKLTRAPLPDFDWELDEMLPPPPKSKSALRADLANRLVDVNQYLMNRLPDGGELTHFNPEETAEAIWIDVKGFAKSNSDVSELLRALSKHDELEMVELASVRHTEANKIEFGMRLKLKPPRD